MPVCSASTQALRLLSALRFCHCWTDYDFATTEKLVTKLCHVDRLNRAGSDKEPLLRIHAVGFGSGVHVPASFTLLMREPSYRNNGTFIGLK